MYITMLAPARASTCQPKLHGKAYPQALTLILLAKTSTRGGLRRPSDEALMAAMCFSSLVGFLCSAHTCTTCRFVRANQGGGQHGAVDMRLHERPVTWSLPHDASTGLASCTQHTHAPPAGDSRMASFRLQRDSNNANNETVRYIHATSKAPCLCAPCVHLSGYAAHRGLQKHVWGPPG